MFDLVPADVAELMTIKTVTPDVVTVSFPFRRYGLIKIGGRGTIVCLTNNTLAVFSAPPLTSAVRQLVQTLTNGTCHVSYLIAPNAVHTLWLADWHAAYPDAIILGSASIATARLSLPIRSLHPNTLTANATTTEEDLSLEVFYAAFETAFFPSHANELLVLHKQSKTLLIADLLFNPPATESYARSSELPDDGLLTSTFAWMRGIEGAPLERQRRILGLVAGKGEARASFAESARVVNEWEFERIVVCHGNVIERDGKEIWRRMVEQFL